MNQEEAEQYWAMQRDEVRREDERQWEEQVNAEQMCDRLAADLAAAQAARDAALRLLAEAAPKCVICRAIATRLCFVVNSKYLYCNDNHGHTDQEFDPFRFGMRIFAALAGQPVADAEREALRDFAAQFSDGVFDDLATDAAGWTNAEVWRRKWQAALAVRS